MQLLPEDLDEKVGILYVKAKISDGMVIDIEMQRVNYCSNIFENNKTCKEVGHFRIKQKLMKENDDLRIYRNVYQKLLLRIRRNPTKYEYEEEFEKFKKKNAEYKDKIAEGEMSQEKYMKWLSEQ